MSDRILLGVVVLNTAIATLCWLGAWQLFQLRKTVQQIGKTLEHLDQDWQRLLSQAPEKIISRRQQLQYHHRRYQQFHLNAQRYLTWGRQSIALVQWGLSWGRGSGNLSGRASE